MFEIVFYVLSFYEFSPITRTNETVFSANPDEVIFMTPVTFTLDKTLAGDTAWLCDWPLCSVLLMNDRRYPWLILVPQRNGLTEVFDLAPKEQVQLWREVTHAAELLKSATRCRKINIGALGNVVSQLHVHVIARNLEDHAGRAAVWGQGVAERYEAPALDTAIRNFRAMLHPPAD